MGKKDKKQLLSPDKDSSKLLDYLKNYGDSELAQPPEEALFDPQIQNISLALTQELANLASGTLFDIGCGKGILLRRLIEIREFIDKKWLYFCTDYDEKISDVLKLAMELKVHRLCEASPLDEFYSTWPDEKIAPRPYIGVLRNLFHELDIDHTTKLLFAIVSNFRKNDVLFIQDLMVFPASERGNACWSPFNFNRLLGSIGFSTIHTPETTHKGNKWFSIIARRNDDPPISYDTIKNIVTTERKKQYEYWIKLGWLAPDDERYRNVRQAKLDFDLQVSALHQQLMKVQSSIVQPLTPEQQSQIVKKTFTKYLNTFNTDAAFRILKPIKEPKCEDRRNHQGWLEEFLRDEDATAAILQGSQMIGKTTLVQKVLSGRAYDKKVVILNVQFTSSIWNIIEHLLSEIGCQLSFELLRSLKNYSFRDIRDDIIHFINSFNDRIIIVIENFERLLNTCGDISDEEIKDLISIIAAGQHAKLIITTRKKPNLQFIPSEKFAIPSPVFGRLPEGPYVEHILDDYNDRTKLGVVDYPVELLKVIDNHPHLAVLAAIIVCKEGKASLSDPDFLNLVKNQLREELLQRIVDDRTRPILEILSLVRIPVPRNMLESLISKECVHAAEEDSLIYNVFDNVRDDLFTIIGPFKKHIGDDDFISADEFEKPDNGIDLHKKIVLQYAQLYREDNDPRWLRELYYHTIVAGDPQKLEEFGLAYKSEIFWAGDYWFRHLKRYDEALWAFETVRKLGLKTDFTEMRFAACLMRVRKPEKVAAGVALYSALIKRNPNWYGVKTSFIDSLLWLKRYQDALDKLIEYQMPNNDDSWIIHEYGKAYLGLHRYTEAISAFERQIKINTDAFVHDILARSYHKIGDAANVKRVLESGLKRYRTNRRLKLTYASYLIRIGTTASLQEAEPILYELYNNFPTDGRILQQYCKLLCQSERVNEAEKIWNTQSKKISAVEYKKSIHISILIAKKQWCDAINELRDISSIDEHLVGMKKKVYLTWARHEDDKNEQRRIALEGLNINMASSLENNIPLMVTSARLARLAGNDTRYAEIVAKVNTINPRVSYMLTQEEDALSYLEEDIF